jgi:Flp pilus assembly protein TadD
MAGDRLAGETPALHNNPGYSYILRGNLVSARRDLLKAYRLDPKNQTIVNNLKLLEGSARLVERSPDVH